MAIKKVIEIDVNLKDAQKQFDKLSDTIQEQKDITIEFEEELVKLENQLASSSKGNLQQQKALRSQIEKLKISLKDQKTSLKGLNNERGKANKKIKEQVKVQKESTSALKNTGKEANSVTSSLDKLTGGAITKFKGLSLSVNGAAKSFGRLRLAIIASGIGALVIGVIALVQAFKRSEEGQNKFAKIMAVIGSVVDNVLDLVADLGEAIIDVFTSPKKALLDFKNLIVENITNRFDAILDTIGFLGSAFKKVFSGDFSGALEDAKKAGSSYVDTLTGVKDTIDKVTKSVKGLKDEVTAEGRIAAKIADDRAKADIIERDLIVERIKATRDINELRLEAEKRDRYTATERIGLLKEASNIAEDIARKEIAANKIRLDALILENSLTKNTKKDKDEVAKLTAKAIQLESKKLNIQRLLQTQITTATNKELSDIKAIEDAKLKAIETQRVIDEKKAIEAATAEEKRILSVKAIVDKYGVIAEEDEIIKLEKEEADRIRDLEKLDATEAQKQKIRDFYADKKEKVVKDQAKEEAEVEKKLANTKIAVMNQSANAVIEIVGRESAVGKAVAVAQAIWNTKNAITRTLASIPAPFNIPAAIATGIFGLSQVKGILATPNPTGGAGGGVSAPSASSVTAPVQAAAPQFNVVGTSDTNQLAASVANQTQQPVQAFVVSTEISSQQSLDRQKESTASFG